MGVEVSRSGWWPSSLFTFCLSLFLGGTGGVSRCVGVMKVGGEETQNVPTSSNRGVRRVGEVVVGRWRPHHRGLCRTVSPMGSSTQDPRPPPSFVSFPIPPYRGIKVRRQCLTTHWNVSSGFM